VAARRCRGRARSDEAKGDNAMSVIRVNGYLVEIDGAAAPPRYVEVKTPHEELDDELEGLIDEALAEWGLGRGSGVRWFAAADCPAAWRVPNAKRLDGPHSSRVGLNGFVDHDCPRLVWLNRGLATEGDKLFWVFTHEVEHVRQELKGECRPGVNDREMERKADAYADSLVPEYRRRRAA
jgi:hypothetical protein